MSFSETSHDGMPVIAVAGRIDSATAPACEEYLLARVGDGRPALVIDLGGVDYISSAGLRVLVLAAKRAMALGIGFAICQVQDTVAEVLEISGLGPILGVHPDPAAAVAAVRG
ncbi:STAS domain-containing protein [Phaeospirillum tilakii]|uniref:Anti-sigma factor antagonist n=1 Tax=Phaeospirillum tilakii TaxID=741673 RepID=A0ABW5CC98_9PROT